MKRIAIILGLAAAHFGLFLGFMFAYFGEVIGRMDSTSPRSLGERVCTSIGTVLGTPGIQILDHIPRWPETVVGPLVFYGNSLLWAILVYALGTAIRRRKVWAGRE